MTIESLPACTQERSRNRDRNDRAIKNRIYSHQAYVELLCR